MKLEKFKEKNQKKRFMIIFTVCCVILLAGVFLYTSFAVFTEDKQFNVINGTYQDPGDLYFAVYIDGKITNTFPKKEDGYSFDASQSSCTNGATVSWDNESWSALINFSNYQAENMSRTKCTVYFKKESTAANFIKDLAETSDELVYDETSDNNLRYIGANPNNYVSFNNELWRIIGVMNNIDDGTGTKESRLKIIRNESIGEYSWDNKGLGTGSSVSDFGSNNWDDSALQIVLNEGAYWNRTSGDCPNGSYGTTTSCNFSSNGLTSEAKSMISKTVWNLGGVSGSSGTVSSFYEKERSNNVFSNHSATWIGNIGLVYPSDYGYATSGGNRTSRTTCLSIGLNQFSTYEDCYTNNWLNNEIDQWTLTPDTEQSDFAFQIDKDGYVQIDSEVIEQKSIIPVTYLSSNVKITGGTGTSNDPYELSL